MDLYDEKRSFLIKLIKIDYRIFRYFSLSLRSCPQFCFLFLKNNILSYSLLPKPLKLHFRALLYLINPFIFRKIRLDYFSYSLYNPAVLQYKRAGVE